jgi:2,3-bisphosphoglycerate-independent phosphoglycerate mutase
MRRSKKNENENTQETQSQRRDRAIVQVPLRDVKPEARQRFEDAWDAREAKVAALKAIKGIAPRSDKDMYPSEGDTLRGSMVRGKDEPAPQPRKVQPEFLQVVPAAEPDATTHDGSPYNPNVEAGEFVAGPETETVDVGGIPTVRRRRRS